MKPRTLDSIEMTAINSLISSHGRHKALNAYLDNCERLDLLPQKWAILYLELYVRYSSEKTDFFIDVVAAKKALQESTK